MYLVLPWLLYALPAVSWYLLSGMKWCGGKKKISPKIPSWAHSRVKADQGISVAITPLAMPLLAGPGAITTSMSYSAAKDLTHLAIVIGIYAFICYITYLLFIAGERIVKIIGTNVMMVITKMMGLILAVIGVQMLALGLRELFNF
jgi:multiple antibiotic resistance protein